MKSDLQRFVLLLMTSRSGSSMVADIVQRHGYAWARDPKKNPLVGGLVRYNSFENQTVKKFNKREFGTPLGEMVTYDDGTMRAFQALVKHEYGGLGDRIVWKGAVEFFPMWWGLHETGVIDAQPMIIWRNAQGVKDSLRAKRGGRIDEAALDKITAARFDTLGMLASEYAFPVIMTDQLITGDYTSLQQAFECYGMPLQGAIVNQTINVSKWETDR